MWFPKENRLLSHCKPWILFCLKRLVSLDDVYRLCSVRSSITNLMCFQVYVIHDLDLKQYLILRALDASDADSILLWCFLSWFKTKRFNNKTIGENSNSRIIGGKRVGETLAKRRFDRFIEADRKLNFRTADKKEGEQVVIKPFHGSSNLCTDQTHSFF